MDSAVGSFFDECKLATESLFDEVDETSCLLDDQVRSEFGFASRLHVSVGLAYIIKVLSWLARSESLQVGLLALTRSIVFRAHPFDPVSRCAGKVVSGNHRESAISADG